MYTEVNGKKCRNGVSYTLWIWFLSMFFCLTALFAIGEDPDLSLKLRMVRPYVKVLAHLTGLDYFKNLERKITDTTLIPRALRRSVVLENCYRQLCEFSNFNSVEKVNCYFKNKKAIEQAHENYNKALKALDAWRNGDTTPSSIVHETEKQIHELLEVLYKFKCDQLDPTQFNTETLALVLLDSGTYFEHKVDSVGSDTEKYSSESTLFFNGYKRFNPVGYRKKLIHALQAFKFNEVRHNSVRQNLAILLLENDDGSCTTLWGDKSDFNLMLLSGLLGFVKENGTTFGMFADLPVAQGKNISIRCNRLESLYDDDFNLILIDLRPQEWCRWNIAQKPVDEKMFAHLKSVHSLSTAVPALGKSKAPVTVKNGHAAMKHVFFDKASGIAADAVVDVNMPLSKVFSLKNIVKSPTKDFLTAENAISSPVVKKLVQVFLPTEEKAAAAQAKIVEGKKLEEYSDYTGAYNLYKQAADLGSDKGRLNCAILLVQNSVTYSDRNGSDISFEIAKQLAAETLEKSKDKKYRGIACNILGVLYNTGGRGLDRNVSLAIKYFEQGVALGDENAIKNLKEMRGDKAPVEVPKATPKAAPVAKPEVKKTVMTPEEKAVAAQAKIEEGYKLDVKKDYVGAYRLYKQAADLGSDKGRLNCAILLAQNKVTYNNDRGYDVSYEVARQFAAEILEKSQDKKYRGEACNILGVLYNTGGKGIRRNVSHALKYFEQGAALGDEFAIKNLNEMRPRKQEAPKVTPAPKTTPAPAPVVKQPAAEKRVQTPEEKAAAAQAKIAEGKNVEETGDYVGAYRFYKQAADLGSDKGRLNCAILLAQDNVTYNNDRGYNVSYEVARQFAAETLEKSQDKKYRGVACNILGVLYNTGGKGIRRNVSLAIKYFEQGAALGDENAIKNLKDMRKARKRSRR